jgi:hypothetical protein
MFYEGKRNPNQSLYQKCGNGQLSQKILALQTRIARINDPYSIDKT